MSPYAKSRFRAAAEGASYAFIAAGFLVLFLLTACQTLPQPPKVVDKVITKYRDIPTWATAQVPNDPPANQSVKAITESNNRRGELIDAVNCRLRLLAKLGKGEAVNAGECKK